MQNRDSIKANISRGSKENNTRILCGNLKSSQCEQRKTKGLVQPKYIFTMKSKITKLVFLSHKDHAKNDIFLG